jgi:hypothetical protein
MRHHKSDWNFHYTAYYNSKQAHMYYMNYHKSTELLNIFIAYFSRLNFNLVQKESVFKISDKSSISINLENLQTLQK